MLIIPANFDGSNFSTNDAQTICKWNEKMNSLVHFWYKILTLSKRPPEVIYVCYMAFLGYLLK